MGLLTVQGSYVIVRWRGKESRLLLSDMELQGKEKTLLKVERRLEQTLSVDAAPATVAVRIDTLKPLKYHVLLGPPGSKPPPNWWNWFDRLK